MKLKFEKLKFGVKVDEEEEDGYVKQILSHDL
jgi:hypothetical protein